MVTLDIFEFLSWWVKGGILALIVLIVSLVAVWDKI